MKRLAAALFGILILTSPAWAIQATVNWTDNSNNEDGFRVERRDGPDTAAWVSQANVAPNVVAFNQAGLSTGIRYCYRVVAFNAFGDAAPSNIACGQADLPLPASGLVVIFAP